MLLASLLIIGIGIILTILSVIIQALPIITPEDMSDTIDMASMAFQILLYPMFFLLYLWSGMRASNNYGFDIVGAGIVASFSSLVITMIKIVLNAVLAVIVVSRPIGNFGFGSMETVVASVLFDTAGISGVGISAICGIGLALIGAMINFVVGGVGGWIALRKKF
jgi:hypothetical protein